MAKIQMEIPFSLAKKGRRYKPFLFPFWSFMIYLNVVSVWEKRGANVYFPEGVFSLHKPLLLPAKPWWRRLPNLEKKVLFFRKRRRRDNIFVNPDIFLWVKEKSSAYFFYLVNEVTGCFYLADFFAPSGRVSPQIFGNMITSEL